jgi:hypothetical protein
VPLEFAEVSSVLLILMNGKCTPSSQNQLFSSNSELASPFPLRWATYQAKPLTCIEIRPTNDHGGNLPPAFREKGTLGLWSDIRSDVHHPIYRKCAGIRSNSTRWKLAIYFMSLICSRIDRNHLLRMWTAGSHSQPSLFISIFWGEESKGAHQYRAVPWTLVNPPSNSSW